MYRLLTKPQQQFVSVCKKELASGSKRDRRYFEALAGSYGIYDKNQIKEFLELAIVLQARQIARSSFSWQYNYNQIVQLYRNQVNLSMRTSQSILLQQYSTPAPIGFLAGVYTRAWEKGKALFEPSAGNGLLTIVADPQQVIVNEIDITRRQNLESQNFRQVWRDDASRPFKGYDEKFDCVITNPPFGRLDKPVDVNGYKITELDHLMALIALQTLKEDGRMAIIIGGHNRFDDKGRFSPKSDLYFFNLLYAVANVEAIINIDGKQLYSRQGTAMDTRLILINGRRRYIAQNIYAPLKNDKLTEVVSSFSRLFERVMEISVIKANEPKKGKTTMNKRQRKATKLLEKLKSLEMPNNLSGAYWPGAFSCQLLDTVVPDTMDFETHRAIQRIKKEVGGDFIEFVRERLGYASKGDVCEALAAEQIDAVAMAIYNIEYKSQGMIIGDQTGIGKGRQAAAVIRYGVERGLKPIFITEKPNLFSDLYRDLEAIGSGHLKPFIVNTRESKTDIKDENGDIIYQAPPADEQRRIINSGRVPDGYDFVLATYSQFNNVADIKDSFPPKAGFLYSIAQNNVMVMDESHNSSGDSNTGRFLREVVLRTRGIVFLSATFAKRPDNMPIYAAKTCISEANMTGDEMVAAIKNGGVALQEIISSQLVSQGQMIRRERTYEGIQVNYLTLDDVAIQHRMIADRVTDIMREIINFQRDHVSPVIENMDKEAASEGATSETRKGTEQAGVDNSPYFSKVFMVINQMLFAIKAPDVADRAIARLKEGKKPVIAFSSTMGAFLDDIKDEEGEAIVLGDTINTDFSEVLRRGLRGVMRYTKTDARGKKTYAELSPADLYPEGEEEYDRILVKIKRASTGISISPIDVIVQRISDAGYTVAEVTGRKYEVRLNAKAGNGILQSRKKVNTNDAFRRFNNNQVDVLLINQSGSTGASAHAVPTDRVPASEVKPRVMIILQAELNINTEVQKRGRINRTGQIHKPEYDYMTSTIPAEMRLMMMLQKKLKSLDANTSSNQKNSKSLLDFVDFLNKYGDRVVLEYLKENPVINKTLGDPLHIESKDSVILEDAAHKVTGRVAILPVKDQEEFYEVIIERYNNFVELLQQTGEYDLEVEILDLQATTTRNFTLIVGKGGKTPFSGDSVLEYCEVNNLRKPFSRTEVDQIIQESLNGKTAEQYRDGLLAEFVQANQTGFEQEREELRQQYQLMRETVFEDARVKKATEESKRSIINQIMEELERDENERAEKYQRIYNNRRTYLEGIIKFFSVGRGLKFAYKSEDIGEMQIPCVFLGFTIDRKKKNPFSPSSIKLRFALADSSRYLALAASNSDQVNMIKGASVGLSEMEARMYLQAWDNFTTKARANRRSQYIITGNLLQAAATYKGKLVSYTLESGAKKKGILLPYSWEPKSEDISNTQVPIIRALPVIKSMTDDTSMYTNTKLYLVRSFYEYKIVVPASKSGGSQYYLNQRLLDLVAGNNFQKSGDKMNAVVDPPNIEKVVEVLQNEFSMSVILKSHQFEFLKSRHQLSNQQFNEDEHVEYSELVDLEAQLLLIVNRPTALNGLTENELTGMTLLVKKFSRIYSAYQCTDLNDVNIAIEDVFELMNDYRKQDKEIPRYVYLRLGQLTKRKEYFQRKQGLSGSEDLHPKIKYEG